MIRILESKTTDVVGKYWYYLICDEGDTKPTGEFPADSGKTIANGSRLFETGTEIRYEYNNGSWTAVGQEQEDVTLKELTLESALPPGVYPEQYDPADEDADGYSLVTLKAPSEEEIAAEWIKIDLTVNVSNKTVTIDSTDEELTAAFETKQTDEPRFYVNVTTEI